MLFASATTAMTTTRLPVSAAMPAAFAFTVLPKTAVAASAAAPTATTTTVLLVPVLAVLALTALAALVAIPAFTGTRLLPRLVTALLALLTRFLRLTPGGLFGPGFALAALGRT